MSSNSKEQQGGGESQTDKTDMDNSALIEGGKWDEADEDEHVRNLYKAEKLLGDVLYRQNMYSMASQHYSSLNNAAFTTPSIIITSAASFLSFAGATDPGKNVFKDSQLYSQVYISQLLIAQHLNQSVNSKTFSLTVGFLGTCATIITALQSAYKFDTKAEMFRTGAAEYRLLTTKISSIMRKEKVYPNEWQKLCKCTFRESTVKLSLRLLCSLDNDIALATQGKR